MTEEDATGDSYTVVLDTLPTADVTVTVAGHASTDVTPSSTILTFTTLDWATPQTVTVTAADDADVTDDTVTLTHTAASTDTDYDGVTFDSVTVTVNDNDTAQVMGVTVASGNAQLEVGWTAVDNATGYLVQWKSGGEAYNTGDRQATIASGSTTSHTIPDLTNDTEYTVRVTATRTGANDGPPSAEVNRHAEVAAGYHGLASGADGDGGEHDRSQLHRGSRNPAGGGCHGDGRRARGHGRVPGPGPWPRTRPP